MTHLPRALNSLLALPDAERRLGPFVLVAPLGRGGFAPVWLARETYGATALRTAAVKLFALDAPDGGDGSPPAAAHRARVIDEARALCRVEHPNIVRFYALPTDEARGVMGLAMEHVAGTPLDRRLAEAGSLTAGETLAIGAAVASALAAVHRAGLVHRDVKPANLVEAGGVYKLIDFGIAAAEEGSRRSRASGATAPARVVVYDDLPLEVSATSASLLDGAAPMSAGVSSASFEAGARGAGTLGYVDPECVASGVPAAPASDLYALGATLFECLSGKLPCSAGRSQGIDGAVLDGTKRAPPLSTIHPDAPPALARLVDALLAPSRRERPQSAAVVALELERLRIVLSGLDRALPPEDLGPFRGLGRFEESDRDVYFGRAGEVAAALDLLRGLGLVALIGSSGSGKSSLARAGVLPRVAEGALGGWPDRWDTAVVTPGHDARGALAAGLAALDPPIPRAAELAPEALVEALAGRSERADRGVLILVDQLEELSTLGSGEGSAWAVDLLGLLGERSLPGVRALVTVRRDLLDPLLGLGKLGRALARGSRRVAPLSAAVWGDVIEQALSTYGYALEDADLREALLAELGPAASAMPLVQFALTELWRKRDRGNRKITRAGLEAIGGIAGALDRHADATLARLDRAHPGASLAARDVLLALTTPQGTRALRGAADLERAGGALGPEVVAALEAARLVAHDPSGVTLAHDALVTQWGTLRAWVTEARADRVLVEEIERDAERFRGDDSAPLWKSRRLEAAEDVLRRAAVSASPTAAAFVRAGRRAERRGRLFAGGSALGVAALGALGVVFYVRDVGAKKAEADAARAVAERSFADATERQKLLEEEQTKNGELLRKLADASDKEAMFALQEEVKKAAGEGRPRDRARAPRPEAGAAPASSPAPKPAALPSAAPPPARAAEPALREKFD